MTFKIIITLILIAPMVLSAQIKTDIMEKSERYQRGWNKLQKIDGEAGENVVNGLKDISPELSQFIIEYSFGDVYSLDKLDNKSKEIAAVASLIAQAAIPQLKVHLNGALNTGSSVNEVKEVILQMSAYVGFPKAINAMNAFREVLTERKAKSIIDNIGQQATPDKEDRRKKGSKALASLDPDQEQLIIDLYDDFSPELTKFVIEYGYGDIYSRDNLDKKHRQIASIAALTTLGNASSQLKFHMKGGLNVGLTVDEINGIMLLMTGYAGFPAAINGTNILKEIVNERDANK